MLVLRHSDLTLNLKTLTPKSLKPHEALRPNLLCPQTLLNPRLPVQCVHALEICTSPMVPIISEQPTINAMRLKGKVLDTTIHTYLGAHKGSVKAGKGILQGLGSPVSEFRAYRVWVKEL